MSSTRIHGQCRSLVMVKSRGRQCRQASGTPHLLLSRGLSRPSCPDCYSVRMSDEAKRHEILAAFPSFRLANLTSSSQASQDGLFDELAARARRYPAVYAIVFQGSLVSSAFTAAWSDTRHSPAPPFAWQCQAEQQLYAQWLIIRRLLHELASSEPRARL